MPIPGTYSSLGCPFKYVGEKIPLTSAIFVYQQLSSLRAHVSLEDQHMTALLRRRGAWFLEQINSQLESDCYEWTE